MRVGRRKLYQSYLNRKEGIERGCARIGSSFERTTQVSRFRFASVLDCNCQAPVNMCQFADDTYNRLTRRVLKKLLKYLKNNPKIAVKNIILWTHLFRWDFVVIVFVWTVFTREWRHRKCDVTCCVAESRIIGTTSDVITGACALRVRLTGKGGRAHGRGGGWGLGRRWNSQKQCTLRHC